MKNAVVSSSKSTGDKNVRSTRTKMSVQQRAEMLVGGRAAVEKIWGKAGLVAAVDDGLSNLAFRVGCLLAMPTLDRKPVSLSHSEIALVMNRSARQIQRALIELEASGYIRVARRRRRANSYEPVIGDAVDVRGKPLVRCGNCRVMCKGLMKTGWCRTCTNEVKLDRKIGGKVDEKLDERGIRKLAG